MPAVPRVSVLMPVLNPHPIYFREAVESVLNQTFGDFELLIIEAPGETSAAPLLADYHDERIRHVANPACTSLVAQRNQAVELARGEWLAMLDADDIAEPHRLAAQLRFVEQQPAIEVIGSQLTIIDGESRPIAARDYPQSHDPIVRAMRRFNPLAQSAVMVRRELVVSAGAYQYDTYFGVEDYELWCRLASRGAKFANLPERLVRYRVQSRQIKSQRMRDQILGTVDIKRLHWRGQFNLGDHCRILAEMMLNYLPAAVVLKLFQATQYRSAGLGRNRDADNRDK